jgi:hypothetical protein
MPPFSGTGVLSCGANLFGSSDNNAVVNIIRELIDVREVFGEKLRELIIK